MVICSKVYSDIDYIQGRLSEICCPGNIERARHLIGNHSENVAVLQRCRHITCEGRLLWSTPLIKTPERIPTVNNFVIRGSGFVVSTRKGAWMISARHLYQLMGNEFAHAYLEGNNLSPGYVDQSKFCCMEQRAYSLVRKRAGTVRLIRGINYTTTKNAYLDILIFKLCDRGHLSRELSLIDIADSSEVTQSVAQGELAIVVGFGKPGSLFAQRKNDVVVELMPDSSIIPDDIKGLFAEGWGNGWANWHIVARTNGLGPYSGHSGSPLVIVNEETPKIAGVAVESKRSSVDNMYYSLYVDLSKFDLTNLLNGLLA